jgi:allantoin racemase
VRLLLINPNTSVSVTERMAAVGRRVASATTEIVAVTAQRGVPYIATRAEAVIGGMVALEMVAEHARDADAIIVAAFGDPGLGGLRELASVPVVGLAEAAMLTACMLGRKFSIVTFARSLGPWYRECVAYHGLEERLAAIRMANAPFTSLDLVQDELADTIADIAERTVREDEADVIILAGAPLAGLADKIRDRVSVPLVDGVAAAIRQAETLAALRFRKAISGTFSRPDPKPSYGLSESMENLLAGK